MSRYGILAAAMAAGAAAQAVATPDAATGITFAAYKEETTGAQFGIVTPETFTGDFIGQLIAPTGNSTGWVGMSLGPSMLNNLLVTAWPNEQEIVSSFRQATDYAPPAPFPAGNITATPIPTGTFVNSTHYAYTFLCTGCLSVQPNWQGDVTGTGIGWALSTNTLGNTASANATLNFHNAGQGIFTLSFTDSASANFAQYAELVNSDTAPTDPTEPGPSDPTEPGPSDPTEPAPTEPSDPDTPGEGGGSPAPTGALPTSRPSRPTRTRSSRTRSSRPTSTRTRRPRPTVTGVEEPTTTSAPSDPEPTSTDDSEPTATDAEPTATEVEPTAAPTGEVPRPTRRPTRTRTKSTKTRKTSSTRRPRATGASTPFRPAFNPDAVSGNDFEESQRFKASFLDGYYNKDE
ncbi:Hypothetical protein D9617_10g072740 [Elsinoe fawcettii]|nr:Hypothetical protein D9617_10g072740 [Elsinoe fawcettii]